MKIRFLLLAAMTVILFPRALSAQVLIKSAGFEDGAVGDWGFTPNPDPYSFPSGDGARIWNAEEEIGFPFPLPTTTLLPSGGDKFWATQSNGFQNTAHRLYFDYVFLDTALYEDFQVQFDFAAWGLEGADSISLGYYHPDYYSVLNLTVFDGTNTGASPAGPTTQVDWQTFTWDVPSSIWGNWTYFTLEINYISNDHLLAGFDNMELWGTPLGGNPEIPEPATLAWGALGLLGGWLAWRRKKAI